jgi:hypothetical protein
MDEKQLRHVLELARREIIASNRANAAEYLRSIRSEVENFEGTSVWAEHQLLFAGTFAMIGDPAAETEFQEALDRVTNLRERDPSLEMRVHDDLARYLEVFAHRPSVARQHNTSAKDLAIECALKEESAKFQLRIIKTDLETDEAPRIKSFHNLKKAAKELGCSFQKQLAAWILYCGAIQEDGRGSLAARKRDDSLASVGYFRGLLTSVRNVDE